MSVRTAQTRLGQAIKELHHHWDATSTSWDDPMSRKFHRTHIASLETMVRTSMASMDKMAELLAKARSDCGS